MDKGDFRNKVILGKLENEMPKLNVVLDAIFIDFPYVTTKAGWDTPVDLKIFWKQAKRLLKPNGVVIATCQFPFTYILAGSNLKGLKYDWVWEKTQATGHLNAKKMPMKAHENVLIFYDKLPTYNLQKTKGHNPINSYTKYVKTQNNTELYGSMKREIKGGGETDRYPRSVITFASDKQKSKLHSTQKPLELVKYFIETYTNPGDLVGDFCAGSGTTGVACLDTGRDFILIEKEPKYVKVINERLDNYLM